jgi:hypothetical protein
LATVKGGGGVSRASASNAAATTDARGRKLAWERQQHRSSSGSALVGPWALLPLLAWPQKLALTARSTRGRFMPEATPFR